MAQNTKILFIVEADIDKAFVELLLQSLGTVPTVVESIELDHLHNFAGTDGKEKRGKDALPEKISILLGRLPKDFPALEHLSIILDLDTPKSPNGGMDKSLSLVNRAFNKIIGSQTKLELTQEAQHTNIEFISAGETINLGVSCFFIKDQAEATNLDELLRLLASQPAVLADCFEQMTTCVQASNTNNPALKRFLKEGTKQWIGYYLRSFATTDQLSDAQAKLPEVLKVRGQSIFDLEHEAIRPLKIYLATVIDLAT